MAADTGMDTCPSPEITDSRKRPLDGDSENGDVKRSHFSSGEWRTIYLHTIHSYVCVFTSLRTWQGGHNIDTANLWAIRPHAAGLQLDSYQYTTLLSF